MAEQDDGFQYEADFLAAILEHDDTPQPVVDYIADLVLEITNDIQLYTPEVLRVAWPLIRRQEGMGSRELFISMVMALRKLGGEETDRILDEIDKKEREDRQAAAAAAERGCTLMAQKKRGILTQRARAIIDDPSRYDADTRHAVRNALEGNAPDLAEYVRRAEQGDTILDLVKPLEGSPHGIAALAEHIAAVLAHPETPEALYNAIVDEFTDWSNDYLNSIEKTASFIESCLRYHQSAQREQPEGGQADDDQS